MGVKYSILLNIDGSVVRNLEEEEEKKITNCYVMSKKRYNNTPANK